MGTSSNYSGTKWVVRKRMKVLFSQGSTWRMQGWQAAPGEESSWYKEEVFLEWEQPFLGTTSPEMWRGPYQWKSWRCDWTGCWRNSSGLPFSWKVGPDGPFEVTSSLGGCGFYELLCIPFWKVSHTCCDDGESPGRVIFAKVISNYQHKGNPLQR